MDVHLDPLGGLSGDMFVAAMLDAFPDVWPAVRDAVASLGLGREAECSLVPHRDRVLTGHRFRVAAEAAALAHQPHHHDHDHAHGHGGAHGHPDEAHEHGHRAWADIRRMLQGAPLDHRVKDHAVAIFTLLAEAEAEVHGVAPDDVAFHEVGAVDSIVDIVAAAQIIERVGPGTWTSAPLPLGSGRVRTAHGMLPVPAPATALLMRGLTTFDDGVPGERVTPTGAAIARYLLVGEATRPTPRTLLRTGIGFGTRTLPGLSNCVRVMAFEPVEAVTPAPASAFAHRELGVVTFEVDDQSGEDLATGLDHVRARDGVHDVIQSVAFGKKGRMATQVQVLVDPAHLDPVIAACFAETTTIGLRFHVVKGAALPRSFAEVEIEGRPLRTKTVERPGGTRSAKTEAADVAAEPGHANRTRLRRAAEDTVLATTQEGRHDH